MSDAALSIEVGSILDWNDFQFHDGETKDKLLVVVGARQGEHLLMVVATSKKKRRQFDPGCNPDYGYYFIPGGSKDVFHKDTWLLLIEPYMADRDAVSKNAKLGTLCVAGKLRDSICNALRNCLRSTDTVPQIYLDLL